MAFAPYPGGAVSKYNNEPGSGRTGYWDIPPNNYDFYSEAEKYTPNIQADGGVLSSARGGAGRAKRCGAGCAARAGGGAPRGARARGAGRRAGLGSGRVRRAG
jgi:hypothetical protein